MKWLSIPGYEGLYQISIKGDIRNIKTKRILKLSKSYQRYKYAALTKDGKQQRHTVHRLVMLAFEGLCPEGMEVHHNDSNPSNNNYRNLSYVTHQTNMQLSEKNRTGNTKLFERDIQSIRAEYNRAEFTIQQLSERYLVAETTIKRIIAKKLRQDIDDF